ncbi:MAG: hypothetical protein EBT42_04715 [Actinobacteria bacterium]|nr:hypothetical protein [Actinomycetota bacterium]
MIEINVEIDDVIQAYSFPTDWSEVSVQQFSNLYGIDKEKYTGMYYTFEVIHQLTGIDRDVIEMMDYHDFVELVKSLNFVFQPVEDKKNDSIIVDGEEYFVHTNFNKYTAGEIISLETIIGSSNGEFVKVMPQLLCIFLRKKKENGNLEKYKTTFMNRIESFKKIKIDEINHIFSFFLTGRASSANNTKDSSNPNENSPIK